MTGRTHDLSAFTALVMVLATQEIPQMTLATAIVGFGAVMIGGLTPDIDEPAAEFWSKLPAGSIIGRIIKPFMGGHRVISHSLLGVFIIGWLMKFLLEKISGVLVVDMGIVWFCFMLGYVSHLVVDSLTKEGVPWFFPIPLKIGFPPFKFMRITTGSTTEKAIIFPGLLLINCYIIYPNYGKFLMIFTNLVK